MESELSTFRLHLSNDGENGRIVIADQEFIVGDVVLSDSPLFTWNNSSMEDYIIKYLLCGSTAKEGTMDMDYHSANDDANSMKLRQASNIISNKVSEIYSECTSELVYKLLQIKRINAHSFRTVELTSGGALFRIATKCNHSCSPNVVYVTMGQNMRYVAVDHIAVGDQILPTYITDLLVTPYHQRQSRLLESKDFACRCRRCLGSDDCRGVRCLTSATTRAQAPQSGKPLCTGIAYRRNTDGVWVCGLCGAQSEDGAMALALGVESDLEEKYTLLLSRVEAAHASLTPASFTDLVKAVTRVGFSRSHHLAVKISRLYVKWMAGQSLIMVEGGLQPDAQVVTPWETVATPVSFLATAVEEALGVVRQLQCVGVCCAEGKHAVGAVLY
jgi:ribosomal protein L37AE/L43A